MLRARKHEVVDELRSVFQAAGAVVVTHYMGMSVAELTALRREMRTAGAGFRITKNTLAKIALDGSPFAPMGELFTGPTAVAYSEDLVTAPKAALAFAKKNERLLIIGGGLADHLLTAEQVKALADLPSLDELRAKLLGLLSTPASRLVGVLQAPGGQVARVLAARAEQVEQTG